MKAEQFRAPGVWVERQLLREGPSPVFVAWKPHVSQMFYSRRSLLRFVAWPAKTPTGDALRAWLDSFEQQPSPAAATSEQQLSPDLQATGFGPECHLDETDPNHNTRTVI